MRYNFHQMNELAGIYNQSIIKGVAKIGLSVNMWWWNDQKNLNILLLLTRESISVLPVRIGFCDRANCRKREDIQDLVNKTQLKHWPYVKALYLDSNYWASVVLGYSLNQSSNWTLDAYIRGKVWHAFSPERSCKQIVLFRLTLTLT